MRKLLCLTLCIYAVHTAQTVTAAAPPEKTFEFAITGGQVAKEQRLIRVDKGTTVKLRLTSDAAGALHLHAYKIEAQVTPGMPREITIHARATGRFRFEWHAAGAAKGGDHHGPPLAVLEVRPK